MDYVQDCISCRVAWSLTSLNVELDCSVRPFSFDLIDGKWTRGLSGNISKRGTCVQELGSFPISDALTTTACRDSSHMCLFFILVHRVPVLMPIVPIPAYLGFYMTWFGRGCSAWVTCTRWARACCRTSSSRSVTSTTLRRQVLMPCEEESKIFLSLRCNGCRGRHSSGRGGKFIFPKKRAHADT